MIPRQLAAARAARQNEIFLATREGDEWRPLPFAGMFGLVPPGFVIVRWSSLR